MNMITIKNLLATAILFACLGIAPNAFAASALVVRLVKEATYALDASYGSQAQYAIAAERLSRAIAEDKSDASIYVQAARLTVKGGSIVNTQFRAGTVDAYGELLDRALALDPANGKAYILKAEYFHLKQDHVSEQAALDKARGTGTKDAWLLIGYGRLHQALGHFDQAFAYHQEARAQGLGNDLGQKNAYVAALKWLAGVAEATGEDKELRELIDETKRVRDPRDVYTLGSLAEVLVRVGLYDEAIAFSRETISAMNYGAARLTPAAALFGKSAELSLADKQAIAAPLLAEARGYGFAKASVLGRFNLSKPKAAALLPTLDALLKEADPVERPNAI
ncbi:hypothetical protein BH11PSE7_BH11PSE7_37110 [soil metagenome]